MADPLSIAASFAGLVGLADVVFARLVKFGRSVKNAEKEIQVLSREINILGGALNSLDRLAQVLKDDAFDGNLRIQNIDDCRETLKEINRKLEKLEATSSLMKQKLMWPFTKDRVKEWLDELSQHKENINPALSANSLDAMLRILSQEDHHAMEILAEIKETRKIANRIHQDSERRKVLDFFLKYNPQKNYDMSIRLRQSGTGIWLQKLQDFQHWLSEPGSKLWLKGIPGAGKTVLAASIIESALKRSTEAIPSAFFFCDYKEADTQVTENILGALVYQLSIQKEDAYIMLERYYNELHPINGLPKQSTRKALQRLLRRILELFDHAYLVVDGLDECGKSTDEVVKCLFDISEDADNVSIALISRDEDEIRSRLEGSFTPIEIAAHKEDITEYVMAEIEERIRSRRLRISSLHLKGEILQGLIDGAGGMFRWVACQLDHLGECDSDEQCREALRSLPPTLDETYERILGRVPKSKQMMTELALNCIAYASPKLNLPQLREILSVPVPGVMLNASMIIREESIARYCSSLVRKSTDGLYLEFSHFSVQEFLEKVPPQRLEFKWLRVSKSRAYNLLAAHCLKFIQLPNFNRTTIEAKTEKELIESRKRLHPLYPYACTCWPEYAKGEWGDQAVFDLAASLFHPSKTSLFTSWAIQHDVWDHDLDNVVEHIVCLYMNPNFTPLHMAAALSLPRMCSFLLLEHRMRVNLESPVGRPLQCAVQRAQSVRHRDFGDHQDSIATADTIRCLCQEGGASLNIQCCDPFPAMSLVQLSLHILDKTGTFKVTMALIQEGARLEEADSLIINREQRLSLYDETEILEFLGFLDKFAGPSTAHHRMSAVLWENAVESDLEFTKDPTIVNTTLSLKDDELEKHAVTAVTSSNAQVLKKILSDPRSKASSFADNDGNSLLHLALQERSRADNHIVKMLLDAGCDVRMTNKQGMDPLQSWGWSADFIFDATTDELQSFDEAARLLSDYGAHCNLRNRENRNALHLHIIEPFRLQALLKHQPAEKVKTALEMVDKEGYTPLTLSLRKNLPESASILLAQRTKITADMIQSPIAAPSLAVEAGDEKTFDSLLLSGIDFGFERTETPLYYISPRTSVQFARRLKTLYAVACEQVLNEYTPVEAYLKSCLETGEVGNINVSIIEELSTSEISFGENSKAPAWECFASRILNNAKHFPSSQTSIEQKNDGRIWMAETVTTTLIQLGYLRSFESVFGKSGILAFVQSFSCSQDISLRWKYFRGAVFEVLRQTQQWGSLWKHPAVILLLNAAAHSLDFVVVRLLLDKGTSVHRRIEGLSILESLAASLGSCHSYDPDSASGPSDTTRRERMFDLVLSHSDKSQINEVIPNGNGLALIHLPKSRDAEQIIKKLVNHGANPNLRVGKNLHSPACIYYLDEDRPDYAKAILNNGADPTLADDLGYDTALTAVFRNNVSMLIKIHNDITHGAKKDWHDRMDWGRKCEVHINVGKDSLTCTGVTALHLGALCPFTDVLRFYDEQNLINDLDVRTNEGHTSLHFAASRGIAANIKYLSARGCDVDSRTKDGSSPLHLAARNNNLEASKVLIEAGCKAFLDATGRTPGIYAHQAGNKKLAALLDSVQPGSDVAGDDSPGPQTGVDLERLRHRTLAVAFRNAVEQDDLVLCKSLYAKGCDLGTSLNDCAGGSLLVEAIDLRRVAIIKWMLQQKVSMTTGVCDSNPVLSAIHLVLKDADIVDVLPASLENYLENGGRLLGETPRTVETAVVGNNIQGLKILLQHAIDHKDCYGDLWSIQDDRVISAVVNEADVSTGWTPMHEAADCGVLEAVKTLLRSGADINAVELKSLQTPLHVAINPYCDIDETVALHLIQEGANLEQGDFRGETPLLRAAYIKRTRALAALINAKADINATDNYSRTVIHFLAQRGSVMAFADLVHRGVNPHRTDILGRSAFHEAIEDASFASLLVNSNIHLEDSNLFPWHLFHENQMSWLTTTYPLFRKRYGLQTLRKFANFAFTGSQAPLCKAAKRGSILVMENLLELGAPIDLEGCPSGSALMAACEAGRKTSVEYLVRLGAALSYTGTNGFRSAFLSAKGNEAILRWLLIGRFIDQLKLTDDSDGNSQNVKDRGAFVWGGPIKVELVIGGQMERLRHESSRQYWSRLMREKTKWRGRVLPPNTRQRTVSHSNIVPREIVRIRSQGYNSNGHEEAWFSKKAPKIQSDGRCWYMSYIDTP